MVELKGGNEQEGEGGEHCRIKAMDPEREREREREVMDLWYKNLLNWARMASNGFFKYCKKQNTKTYICSVLFRENWLYHHSNFLP